MRSYSQLDRGTVQRIDVTEGLESTLVMLGHKLKPGVVVQRELRRATCPRSRPRLAS